VTQHNAALAGESTSAASSLESQAARRAQLLARLHLGARSAA